MTVDGCKNWKMIKWECSGQWTCAEVNCSLILQTSSWFLASPIAPLHSSPVAAWSPSWPSDLQTSKLIVTSYFCVGDMFWWPPATGGTSLHPSTRLLSLEPESSESSWLSSESNLSWIVVKSLHYAAMDRLSLCPPPWAGLCWPVCGHECWLRYCHRKVRIKLWRE